MSTSELSKSSCQSSHVVVLGCSFTQVEELADNGAQGATHPTMIVDNPTELAQITSTVIATP